MRHSLYISIPLAAFCRAPLKKKFRNSLFFLNSHLALWTNDKVLKWGLHTLGQVYAMTSATCDSFRLNITAYSCHIMIINKCKRYFLNLIWRVAYAALQVDDWIGKRCLSPHWWHPLAPYELYELYEHHGSLSARRRKPEYACDQKPTWPNASAAHVWHTFYRGFGHVARRKRQKLFYVSGQSESRARANVLLVAGWWLILKSLTRRYRGFDLNPSQESQMPL